MMTIILEVLSLCSFILKLTVLYNDRQHHMHVLNENVVRPPRGHKRMRLTYVWAAHLV